MGGNVPFFLMQDTAWALARLSNSDIDTYLTDRAGKGFNAILIGLKIYDHTPHYGDQVIFHDDNGDHTPWTNNDPSAPDCAFWKHIDDIVSKAADKGMYVSITIMWSYNYPQLGIDSTSKGLGKAYNLGRWIGDRYKNNSNIIWVVSGEYDYYCQAPSAGCKDAQAAWKPMYDQVAQGLIDGDLGSHLLTIHPGSDVGSSSAKFQSSSWLSFNFLQTGHYINNHAHTGSYHREGYDLVTTDYNNPTVKPVVEGEVGYEDLPDGFFWNNNSNAPHISAADVRRKAYWEVFAGASGHTYGDANVENFNTGANIYGASKNWRQGLRDPGSGQMQYLKNLMESHSYLNRIPDQSVVTKVAGKTGTGGTSLSHCAATRASDGSYALVYTPQGDSLTIDMTKINATANVKARWYKPSDGSWKPVAGAGTYSSTGTQTFTPPAGDNSGIDWVLVLSWLLLPLIRRMGRPVSISIVVSRSHLESNAAAAVITKST